MIKLYIALLAIVGLMSCQRLNDLLFNADNTIKEYKLDAFDGEVDFVLDSSYDIADSLIHLFTLDSDGFKIYALYIGDTSKISSDTVILYSHGNKWHIDFYWQRAKLLAHTGGKNRFGVMMIDYRGYGLSEGKHTEEALYVDTEMAIKWLKSKGMESERLIMYGFSLGSAPATKLTAKAPLLSPGKLILENPFASAAVMVQDAAKLALPVEYFANLKVDVAEQIKSVSQPFMWMHGVNDDFLSINSHGEMVYKNYSGRYSEVHRIEGANHGNLSNTWGFENYLKAIELFITSN
jgi:pimeloyl-ACP methyl ester carboxylesterase